uniref:Transmembrane protein n=1 Tax=Ditylenchus dipsaci TaxID=166011 RepID=A0A915DXK6_9BILA
MASVKLQISCFILLITSIFLVQVQLQHQVISHSKIDVQPSNLHARKSNVRADRSSMSIKSSVVVSIVMDKKQM